jgi:hypothetical protein
MYYAAQYVNHGLEAIARTPELLQLRMDTWYYADIDHLGDLALGNVGVTAETGMPAFVVEQLAHVLAGFGPYVRFAPTVLVGHKPTLKSIRAFVAPLVAQIPEERLEKLQRWLQQTPDIVTLIVCDFDLYLAVRTASAAVVDHWLPLVGRLSFSARLDANQEDAQTHISTVAWQGGLDLRVLSLFRRDNEVEIQHARALWERFHDADPEIDLFPEKANEDPIVVLAESPAGTPPDNEELCKRNLPRLRTMINAWEAMTGSRFHWTAQVG